MENAVSATMVISGDAKTGVKPNLWVNPCHDGKGNRLGDKGQRHTLARQNIAAYIAKPLILHKLCT
jgi:hypothetical protein